MQCPQTSHEQNNITDQKERKSHHTLTFTPTLDFCATFYDGLLIHGSPMTDLDSWFTDQITDSWFMFHPSNFNFYDQTLFSNLKNHKS